MGEDVQRPRRLQRPWLDRLWAPVSRQDSELKYPPVLPLAHCTTDRGRKGPKDGGVCFGAHDVTHSDFEMGNKSGTSVAMTNKTSDYWQGDEAKFTESFKGGSGAVYFGEVKFDLSTQAYLVQL